jgi:hypothetical protein
MRRRPYLTVIILVLCGLMLTVATGCGKKKSTTSTVTTESTTTTSTSTETTTTTATTTTTPTSTSTTGTSTSALGAFASSGNCAKVIALEQNAAKITSGQGADTIKNEAAAIKLIADNAPSDIKPDFEVYSQWVQKVAAIVGNLKPGESPSASQIAQLAALETSSTTSNFATAAAHIGAWVAQNCHA